MFPLKASTEKNDDTAVKGGRVKKKSYRKVKWKLLFSEMSLQADFRMEMLLQLYELAKTCTEDHKKNR